jgi:hypothetical protein
MQCMGSAHRIGGILDELSVALAPWLDTARITGVRAEPTGTGQMSDSLRVHLSTDPPGALPATLVVKRSSSSEMSRAASRVTRTYEVEAAFYRDLRDRLDVRAPHCWHVSYDADRDDVFLVLEDLAPCRQGDQIVGCTPQEAEVVVDELVRLQGPLWGSVELESYSWLNRITPAMRKGTFDRLSNSWPGFVERYAERLSVECRALGAAFVADPGDYFTRPHVTRTVVHGDFRLDNLLFLDSGGVAVVDFQTTVLAEGLQDLAYFLGAGLTVPERRLHEQALIARYVTGLAAYGVAIEPTSLELGVRRYAWAGLVMAVCASMLVERTERGDEMFVTMANRHSAHAADCDSLGAVKGMS